MGKKQKEKRRRKEIEKMRRVVFRNGELLTKGKIQPKQSPQSRFDEIAVQVNRALHIRRVKR